MDGNTVICSPADVTYSSTPTPGAADALATLSNKSLVKRSSSIVIPATKTGRHFQDPVLPPGPSEF